MFNTATKPPGFMMDLKRATIANNSTAFSSHQQTNQLKRQSFIQSKLLTTRQSIFNPRSTITNNQSSISQKQKTFNAGKTQRDQNIDTSQISALISVDIKNDQKISKRDFRTQFRSQTYVLTISKVVTQKSRPIPQIIKQAYKLAKEQKSSQDQKVNFCQGYLEKANIIYYAVQKDLFLFNGQQLCNSKPDINRDSSYKKVTLREVLFKIYQVTFKNNLIQRKMQNQILLFSYPYQIQFCAYENSPISSEIKLIDLEYAYALDTKKGEFFQSTVDGKIIYLDNEGKLNYISTQQKKTLGLIGNGKYSLKNNTASRFIRNQFFANQDGFWNKIRLAYRKATNYTASLLPFRHQNFNLIYDQKREMIFTLTAYTENKTFQTKRKMIKVFNIVDSNFIPTWSISEQQILENVASKRFFRGKSITTGIKDICKVEKDYIRQSNLLLILNNATRVYLDITQDRVNIVQIIYAPQFSSLQSSSSIRQKFDNNLNSFRNANPLSSSLIEENANINFQKELRINQKQSSQTELKGFYSKNSIFITLAVHQKNVYSLFYNKEAGQSQNQKLMNIQWKDKITNESQLPYENYLYKISDNFMIQTESMRMLSNDNQICDSNQYLRQVFYPPLRFYYCNDIFASKFFLLRPIDILFSVIKHHSFFVCQKLLPKLFNNVSLKQVCVMLIQIYTNQQGIYYESSDFNQSINKIVERQFIVKNGRNSEIGYRVTEYQSKKKFQGKNAVKKVQFKQITKQILGLIQKLFLEFTCHKFVNSANELDYFFSKIDLKISKNQQKQTQKDKTLIKNQFGSIILYVSRIYHPLWDKLIQNINEEQNNSYLKKIKSLKKMNALFNNKSTEQVWKLKLDGFFQKSVQILNMISVIKNFPKITFQECFQKDAKFFQEYIFKAIDKFYQSNILSKCQNLFPMYLSPYFKRIIKMYQQVRVIVSHSKIVELLKQQPCLPRYFIQYLVNTRQIHQARILRVQGETRVVTAKLRIPADLTLQGEINFIFQQVKNGYRPIRQKLFYLQLAQQRINKLIQNGKRNHVNYPKSIIREMKQTHQEFQKCLNLQRLMKQQYESLESKPLKQNKKQSSILSNLLSWTQNSKEAQNNSFNSFGQYDQNLTLLQNRTFQRQKIRLLLQKLNSPKLLIIFYTLFSLGQQYNHQNFQQNINLYSNQFKSIEFQSQQIKFNKNFVDQQRKFPKTILINDDSRYMQVQTSFNNDQLEIQWEKLMIALKQKTQMEKGSDKSLQNFTKQIKSLVRDLVAATRTKLDIKILMKSIDKQFYSSPNYMQMLKSKKNGECFFLGAYLRHLNCDRLKIIQYYNQAMKNETKQQKMKNMEIYFYIWFNCLQFITKYSTQSIRTFITLSQEYIRLDSKLKLQLGEKVEISVMKMQLKKLQK